jgi:hypothetical protein
MRLCERVNASVAPSVAKRSAAQICHEADPVSYGLHGSWTSIAEALIGRPAPPDSYAGAAHDAALCGWPVLLALL